MARVARTPRKRASTPPGLVRMFDVLAASLRRAEQRRMFGYPALFVNGNMFAGLLRGRMVLRLAERDRDRFLELRGAAPFIAMGGRRMKHWVVVPPAMLKS